MAICSISLPLQWRNIVLAHYSVLLGYTRLGITWANEMNFGMNHGPGAGSIARFAVQGYTMRTVLRLPHIPQPQILNAILLRFNAAKPSPALTTTEYHTYVSCVNFWDPYPLI